MNASTAASGKSEFHTAEAELFAEQYRVLQTQTGRLVPPRKAFTPAAMRKLLPYIALLEVCEPNVIFVRLVGTAVINRGRVDMTGQNLFDFYPPEERDWAWRHHMRMLQTPCGSAFLTREHFESLTMFTEIVNYPLADDSGAARLILGIAVEVNRQELMLRGESAMQIGGFVERRYIDIGAGTGSEHQ